MSGILIYSRAEAARNAFSVEKYKKYLGVSLMYEEDVDFDFPADFVINRTNKYEIAREFERRGIRVFNPSALSRLANDKQLCYEYMRENGVEILPIDYMTPPLIMKPAFGKGGNGVHFVEQEPVPQKRGFVYQKPASDMGRDLRVWLLGGRIMGAVLRESDSDFRANFCLGGRASLYHLSSDEIHLIDKISSFIEYDYIGLDFVFDGGRAVFNEIEDAVGARMLYSLTETDIIREYCTSIKQQL